MLRPQGWQDCAQSFYPLALLLSAACFLLASCVEGNRGVDDAERSAFGTYVNALDTSSMEKNLKHILLSDTSHWKADRMVRQRYADIRSFDSIPLWFSRLGVSWMADSLLACLQREVPRNGLDTTAFFLEQITQDLEIVHTLAFDSLGISINEVLPRLDYCLSKAYIRYTVGQRYGFMRPDVVFNHLDKKANTEDFARLFDHEVAAPDYKEALRLLDDESRMDYLKTSQPANPIYQTFQRQLASTTDKAMRRKLAFNMERCRWQIKQQEAAERTVLVNIPAQQLWAVGPDSVLSMRICCGAKASKTPCSTVSSAICRSTPTGLSRRTSLPATLCVMQATQPTSPATIII